MVDWTQALQAADVRGNTWPVEVVDSELGRKMVCIPAWKQSIWVNEDGTVPDRCFVIRNVATPAPKYPEALVERAFAFVRWYDRGANPCHFYYDVAPSAFARAIVAELPAEVDADREEAVRIASEWYSEEAPHLEPLLAAIKAGRILETSDRITAMRNMRDQGRALEREHAGKGREG